MNRHVLELLFLFIGFTIFEIAIYLNVREKLDEFSWREKRIEIEIEELQKTQRLIAQDAESAMRLVIESGVKDDEKNN